MKKKINRDKIKRIWKVYNVIMTNFWLLIAFCLAGVGVGYLINKANPTENNMWLIVISIIGFSLGIINFFFRLIVDILKLNKTETKEIKEMIKENPQVFNNLEENSEQLEKDRLELIEKEEYHED